MRKSIVLGALFILACGGGSKTATPATDGGSDGQAKLACMLMPPCTTSADCTRGWQCYQPTNPEQSPYCNPVECIACMNTGERLCQISLDTCTFYMCGVQKDGGAKDSSGKDSRVVDAKASCHIGSSCATDGDCATGLTCQKFDIIDGVSAASMICAPAKCASCSGKTCIVDQENSCDFVACKAQDAATTTAIINDAGSVDKSKPDANRADTTTMDAQSADVSPVPPAAQPPAMAIACEKAALAPAPCGGDLTGNWQIVGLCDNWLSETELVAVTAKTCSVHVDQTDTGSAVFNADGTCIMDEKNTWMNDYAVSCLSDTCAASDQNIKKEIGTDYVTSASCALASPDICRCDNTFDSPSAADACTYTASGTGLKFISAPSTFSAKTYQYCVQGDTLNIFFSSYSPDAADSGKNASMVLTRQRH